MLGVNAAAEGSQRRTAVVLRMRREMQFKEERQTESVSYRWKQPKGKDRTNMKEEARVFEVYLAQWIGLEHREEVHEKIHRRVRYLPLERAQIEKERKWRSSSTERPRRDGYLQRMQRESQERKHAVRIVNTRRVEFSLPLLVIWEQLSEKKKENWHQHRATRAGSPRFG